MEFVFGIGIVALLFAVVNSILIIVRLVQRKLSIWLALIIIAASILLPYGMAVLAAMGSGGGWAGLDAAFIMWIWSGLALMLGVFIYLASLKKTINTISKTKQENPELLDD